MANYASLIPVNVITGFLGSGKTTLLQSLLASPDMSDAAVLINEFGEVALDHHLLMRVDENTTVLGSGCVCCTVRDDLVAAMKALFSRRERGDIPRFRRLVIETSGLADPASIVFTVLREPVLQYHFRLGNIVTTVDAVNGGNQLSAFPESLRQVAMADRIVLTKTDLSTPEAAAPLLVRLREINPAASIRDSATGDLRPGPLLFEDVYDSEGKMAEAMRWIEPAAGIHGAPGHAHTEGVQSFAITYDRPLNWTAFGIWLTMLLQRHGQQVLRVKAVLNVQGSDTPVAVHGVQHIVHPPVHLPGWPDGERRSRIVFIVKGLERGRIEASLDAFNRLGNP